MTREERPEELTGIVLDERIEMTLVEICRACAVESTFVVELVAEGVLEPLGGGTGDWRFAGADLRRTAQAARLQRDLDLNAAGVALVLQLLEEIAGLRARLGERD